MLNLIGCLNNAGGFAAKSLVLQNVVCQPMNVVCRTGATHTIPVLKKSKRPTNRHRDPLYRRARALQTVKLELPDFEFERKRSRDEVTPEEMKERMKKIGISPPGSYQEKPTYISSTGAILDEYVPVEGDGKASAISTDGALQVTDKVKGKGKTFMSIRKIRSYHDDFDPRKWVDEAEDIYIQAHEALANKDEDEMHKLVTEKCFPEMMHEAKRKTIHWKYIKAIEPPRVVHARHANIASDSNMFGQLTVRFHSQQTLAVYDRFGRLIHGNENVVKDVLEYCVFEKHLSNLYGIWRLHGKIIPDWKPRNENFGRLTYRLQPEIEEEEEETSAAAGSAQQDFAQEDDDQKGATIYDRFGRILKRN
eukprot:TRINITY_DN2456_c0_g1_i1.p1 TRINITY_DN2456_c0_g1~~TRINITY_DN2456_c0_g1_i1.p1  ORF type:complete len:364 (-),score=98.19 TRINITY_DN2456_c0_g1_i1:121-1212(-)